MTTVKETHPSFKAKLNQMRRGLTEYAVLSLIYSEDGAYALEIIDTLIHTEFAPAHSTVYYILSKFLREGLVFRRFEESDTPRAEMYYFVTEKGAAFIKEFDAYWRALAIDLYRVKKLKRSRPSNPLRPITDKLELENELQTNERSE